MAALLEGPEPSNEMAQLIELGLNHEQQHQELLLTDIKHAFGLNPTRPPTKARPSSALACRAQAGWVELPPGIYESGAGEDGFAFDSERPRHRHYVHSCRVATQPVTCRDYLEFMSADGYRRSEFWLSDGWATVQARGLGGPALLEAMRRGLAHLPAGRRRRSETRRSGPASQLLRGIGLCRLARPAPADRVRVGGRRRPIRHRQDGRRGGLGMDLQRLSALSGVPAAPGAVGEYNGKFMSGQMVLGARPGRRRGGTPGRPTGTSSRLPPAGR
jgi:hypothetical protein